MKAEPQVVVVETGYWGLTKASNKAKQYLDKQDIQLVIKNGHATKAFNNLSESVRKL